jgi:branched-chain amino acid transport system permease protein
LPERISFVSIILWGLRLFVVVVIVWGSVSTIASGRYTLQSWAGLVVAGLAQGSIYSLVAIGYSLVYGILRIINFAHGEVFMAGALTSVINCYRSSS